MRDTVATNIRLPRQEYAALKVRARSDGRSIAAHVRDAIRLYLEGREQPHPSDGRKRDRLLDIIGMVDSGVSDASVEHDHYIYGVPKRGTRSRKR